MASDDDVRALAHRHLFAVRASTDGRVVIRGVDDVWRHLGMDPRHALDDPAAERVGRLIGEVAAELRRRAARAYG